MPSNSPKRIRFEKPNSQTSRIGCKTQNKEARLEIVAFKRLTFLHAFERLLNALEVGRILHAGINLITQHGKHHQLLIGSSAIRPKNDRRLPEANPMPQIAIKIAQRRSGIKGHFLRQGSVIRLLLAIGFEGIQVEGHERSSCRLGAWHASYLREKARHRSPLSGNSALANHVVVAGKIAIGSPSLPNSLAFVNALSVARKPKDHEATTGQLSPQRLVKPLEAIVSFKKRPHRLSARIVARSKNILMQGTSARSFFFPPLRVKTQ